MPFKSEAQRKWMHDNHPEMAKKWENETPNKTKLPDRVDKPVKRRAPRMSKLKLPSGGHHQ